MEFLIEQLTANTQNLKEEFLLKTETWASSDYDSATKMSVWSEVEWCKFLGLQPETRTYGSQSFFGFPKNFYNSSSSKVWRRAKDKVERTLRLKKSEYIKRELDLATQHYIASIEKLAHRIVKKGIDLDTIEMTNGRVGVNLEVIIKDSNEKFVRAWTIIAEGEIQRPHYRYLIK